MGAPRSTFYPGLAATGRIHLGGFPLALSVPAFLIVTFATVAAAAAAFVLGWPHPALYVLSALPLYVVAWQVEKRDPAICWLVGSWLRHVGASLLVGRVPGLRAVTRDPWGA